jgi:ribose transport system substrate-binding protein
MVFRQSRRPSRLKVLGAALVTVALVSTLAACATGSGTSSTPGASKKGPFKIAVANGYTGNTWRTQFLADLSSAGNYYKQKGEISTFTVVSAGTDVNAQLSQISQLILQKPDAILIAPISGAEAETAAAKVKAAGILPIIIDDPAPTPSAMNIVPSNEAWFSAQAKWLATELGGKGNIAYISGLAGNPSDTARTQAANKVLAAYPGIHIVASAPGNWDPGVSRQAMASILSSHSNIDGVLEQDIEGVGVLQAFQSAGLPLPKVMTGDYTQAFLKEWATLPNLDTLGVPYSPTDGADALGFAVRLLQGKKLKASSLSPNSNNPSIKNNTVLLPPSLAITRDGKPGSWTPAGMRVISLAAALKLVAGKPSTYAVEAPLSQSQIDAYFQ